jgi:beta-aspartyl-dipeptidase (metallo-type)
MLDAGVSVEHISFSSDANASLPVFDSHGNFEGLGVGRIASLFEEVRDAVVQEKIPLDIALQVASKTPAKILNLARKGHLNVGADADIVLLDEGSLMIRAVIARGVCLWQDGSFESLPIKRFNPFY